MASVRDVIIADIAKIKNEYVGLLGKTFDINVPYGGLTFGGHAKECKEYFRLMFKDIQNIVSEKAIVQRLDTVVGDRGYSREDKIALLQTVGQVKDAFEIYRDGRFNGEYKPTEYAKRIVEILPDHKESLALSLSVVMELDVVHEYIRDFLGRVIAILNTCMALLTQLLKVEQQGEEVEVTTTAPQNVFFEVAMPRGQIGDIVEEIVPPDDYIRRQPKRAPAMDEDDTDNTIKNKGEKGVWAYKIKKASEAPIVPPNEEVEKRKKRKYSIALNQEVTETQRVRHYQGNIYAARAARIDLLPVNKQNELKNILKIMTIFTLISDGEFQRIMQIIETGSEDERMELYCDLIFKKNKTGRKGYLSIRFVSDHAKKGIPEEKDIPKIIRKDDDLYDLYSTLTAKGETYFHDKILELISEKGREEKMLLQEIKNLLKRMSENQSDLFIKKMTVEEMKNKISSYSISRKMIDGRLRESRSTLKKLNFRYETAIRDPSTSSVQRNKIQEDIEHEKAKIVKLQEVLNKFDFAVLITDEEARAEAMKEVLLLFNKTKPSLGVDG